MEIAYSHVQKKPRHRLHLPSHTMDFKLRHSVLNVVNAKRIVQTSDLGPRPPETPKARRHGAPAGPWPWKDFSDLHPELYVGPVNSPTTNPKKEWRKYPQSLFPNWKPSQVRRSKIEEAIQYKPDECVIRYADLIIGQPSTPRDNAIRRGHEEAFWEQIQAPRPPGVWVRTLFLDKPSGILSNPFFFSSSLNRIPTRYQEKHHESIGDHITITLLFVSVVDNQYPDGHQGGILPVSDDGETDITLLQELLAIHMVRSSNDNTIISYHPNDSRSTAAKHLQSRVVDAGLSVYWTDILENTEDPTFVLLIYMWYAFYAWDQALEQLYVYISRLERRTTTNFDTRPTQTMHNIHAHLLSYASLLRDFKKSVEFILDTPNPTKDYGEGERQRLQRECDNLLSEIERLEVGRETHTERLKNAMNLLFSSVNLHDSEQMRRLTQVTVRDSRAMKQVSILTMIFLPASFVASAFGMNITALSSDPDIKGTLEHYVLTAIPLTVLTIWFIVASQTNAPGSRMGSRGWRRLAWPYSFLKRVIWPDRPEVVEQYDEESQGGVSHKKTA
ncbi:hypothetical protein FPV67DRAFT_1508215 [Lyophyllum atratum]|nr:hypothetical protein FPV67DRAFT_1508215 [Lyophyllum atratum]